MSNVTLSPHSVRCLQPPLIPFVGQVRQDALLDMTDSRRRCTRLAALADSDSNFLTGFGEKAVETLIETGFPYSRCIPLGVNEITTTPRPFSPLI